MTTTTHYDELFDQKILNEYQQAAENDEYLFGDYDYCKEWVGITTLDA